MKQLRTVGRYEILDELGRGGMALVYLARQTDLDRLVALKELGAFHASDPSFAERFLRESRVAGSLSHPNIVTVYDFFQHDGKPYIAMEYVERGSLRAYIGHMDVAQIGGVLEGLLAGLAAAEQQGIVHRDLKPENLMVTADGRVKITDFGIAKATREMPGEKFLTATGTTVGTPTYMAPEQAMAQEIGPWTDLYSVGCMAYEMFTGHVPFHDSDAPMAILLRHVNEPIPLASTVSDTDPEISAWIDRLLAKDPHERTQSASAAWDELEGLLMQREGARWRRSSALPEPPSPDRPSPSRAPSLPGFETPPPPSALPAPAPPGRPPGPPPSAPPASAPQPPVPPPSRRPAPAPQPSPWTGAPIEIAVQAPPGERGAPFAMGLNEGFQYVHGPVVDDDGGVRLAGNDEIVRALKERLVHSAGGSFLITGFRGVGKTTVVLRALQELRDEAADDVQWVPVVLSVARPMTIDQLLFEVVRRLFEALTDGGVLDRLSPDVRQALLLAYVRTSLSFKETSSRGRESTQSLGIDVAKLGVPALGFVTPKVGVTRKRTETLAREASFLAYSHADVEHDFLRILDLLAGAAAAPSRRRLRWSRNHHPPWRGRLVVVLDELDKLTTSPDGTQAVDDLLMGLKNLLTARGVHFMFVGGPELHDAFMRDVARGNSVYESVFACHVYVPCLWQASRTLLERVVDPPAHLANDRLPELANYLDFKSRGIPRLLIRELNDFVRWADGHPVITVDEVDAGRVAFYARVQAVVDEFLGTAIERELLSMPIDEDRWRLGAYYITEWILRCGASPFTVPELLADEATPASLMHASHDRVERLVKHFVAHRFVEALWTPDSRHTVIADAGQASVYRLAPAVLAQLASFARRNERERAELQADHPVGDGMPSAGPAGTPWSTGAKAGHLGRGRYEIGELIGVGGVGRVYRAVDRRRNREVAIKVLAPHLLQDTAALGRWRREAEVAKRLDHPHIVHTYDVVDDGHELTGIVMELVEGPSLRSVLPLAPASAVAVACQLLGALAHAWSFGLARFDIKPENVVFHGEGRAVIVDLGLVRPASDGGGEFHTIVHGAGATGLVVGTPAYMSPEQAGGSPVDIRSDIYCVALVLYETIVGRHPRDVRGPDAHALQQAMGEPVDLTGLDVSAELLDVLTCALSVDPSDRFDLPAAMSDALLRTPEGVAGAALPPHELLTPRDRQPTRGRLAVLPALPDPHMPTGAGG